MPPPSITWLPTEDTRTIPTEPMPKKVLIINTSASTFGAAAHPTGVWLEETATPYYAFKKAGFEVEMASPLGGPSPIDAASLGEGFFTDAAKQFMHDPEAFGM